MGDATNKEEVAVTGRPDGKVGVAGDSLQAAFSRFSKERKRAKQITRVPASKLRAEAALRRVADPAGFKKRLRRLFIDQCKKYIGIPYAERYHASGDPLHGRPLYLDCCALVRRAVEDLRADFGFDVGRWNQAYQFATLPVALEGHEVAEPGDLMFVEATYKSGRHRQQKLNIVHVEVYLGAECGMGPESTLGSRNRWGCVEVHDTWRYESQFYDITNVYWRSLDTWLDGKCDPVLLADSFKNHDPYGDVSQRLSKKSVFAAACENADDDEDDDLAEDVGVALTKTAANEPPKKALTLLDVASTDVTAAAIARNLDFTDLATFLQGLSPRLRSELESADVAPALWRAVCVETARRFGLYVPPKPPNYGEASQRWKRCFFDCLWHARHKWDGSDAATAAAAIRRRRRKQQQEDDCRIEVCVRFRDDDEDDDDDDDGDGSGAPSADAAVALPLHQFLKVVRRHKEGQEEAPVKKMGRLREAPAEFLDAAQGTLMRDPVIYPNSGAVVDGAWARPQADPYDGSPLAPGVALEALPELERAIATWRMAEAETALGKGGHLVAGSEVVRCLCGEGTEVDREILEAVLEAERLAATAQTAHESAQRFDNALRDDLEGSAAAEESKGSSETPRSDEADEEERATVTATELTVDLEASERRVKEIEEACPEAPSMMKVGSSSSSSAAAAKVLAIQVNRVVMYVAGAGVKPYTFSRVWGPETGQGTVYSHAAAPCVAAVLNGSNACLLCYGQTGSGKTHTSFGPPGALELLGGGLSACDDDDDDDDDDKGVAGLVPRVVAALLRAAAAMENVRVAVAAQYVEIYNGECVDLLTGAPCAVRREDGALRGAVEAPLEDLAGALRLLRAGGVRRRFAATAMNARSSRSHAVVVLTVRQRRGDALIESQLHLVDLAGSERLGKSRATGARQAEATRINESLLVLGKVIAALVDRKSHVPYLESTLTTLLRAALGGTSRTAAVVCCRKSDAHADETLQALRFAKRCALVSNQREALSTVTSAREALETMDATIAHVRAAIANLDVRNMRHLPAYRTLKTNLDHASRKRRALADYERITTTTRGTTLGGAAAPLPTTAETIDAAGPRLLLPPPREENLSGRDSPAVAYPPPSPTKAGP